jgi:hypothetical protein
MRKPLWIMLIVVWASASAWGQSVTQPILCASREPGSAVSQFGIHDTFYCQLRLVNVSPGTVLGAAWYDPSGRRIVQNTWKLSADFKANSCFGLSPPSAGWRPGGGYRVDISLDGQIVQRGWFSVGEQRVMARSGYAPETHVQRYSSPQTSLVGRWVRVTVLEDGRRAWEELTIDPSGAWSVNVDGKPGSSGRIEAANGRYASVMNGRRGTGSYQLGGDVLSFVNDNGTTPNVWYREGTQTAIRLARQFAASGHSPVGAAPAPTPSPTTSAVPSPRPAAALSKVERVETVRWIDSRHSTPTKSFTSTDRLTCAVTATLARNAEIVALWRNPQGAIFRRASYRADADQRSTRIFVLRPDDGPWTPGPYSVEILLNDQPQGTARFEVAAAGPAAIAGGGSAGPTRPSPSGGRELHASDDRRDLEKVKETPAAIQKARKGNRYALLIGVGKYDNADVRPLKYSDADVEAVRKVLADPRLGGVPPAHIKVLTETGSERPTLEAVGKALNWLAAMASHPADTAIIYFAGHGYNDANGSYLATVDSDPQTLLYTALNISIFNKAVESIPAHKKIIILDACHAGGMSLAARGDGQMTPQMYRDLQERTEGEVRLLSCTENESSYEDASFGHGVFSYFLVKGMEGEADVNRDGIVTFGELEEYVKERVRRYAAEHGRLQTPRADASVTGVIIMTDKGKK